MHQWLMEVSKNVRLSSDFEEMNEDVVVLWLFFLDQPPPPVILQDPDEAFTICWESVCNRLDLIIGPCSVQYRTEDQDWREVYRNLFFSPNYACCVEYIKNERNARLSF